MQLFSIGLWSLNMDGTKKFDNNDPAQPIHAYDSTDIMNMARAWTGFSRQRRHRGNAESPRWGPHVDPMYIDEDFRDIYPKADLLGGYIGKDSVCSGGFFKYIDVLGKSSYKNNSLQAIVTHCVQIFPTNII